MFLLEGSRGDIAVRGQALGMLAKLPTFAALILDLCNDRTHTPPNKYCSGNHAATCLPKLTVQFNVLLPMSDCYDINAATQMNFSNLHIYNKYGACSNAAHVARADSSMGNKAMIATVLTCRRS